mgnify:CR=1 FL=1
MKITKDNIISNLKNVFLKNDKVDIVSSKCVQNVVIFDNEILIDLLIDNPTLQAKQSIKKTIENSLQKFSHKFVLKINFIIKKTEKAITQIRGIHLDNVKNIIAVSSGKGGVGKSTITSNIAISLKKMGFEVGILDADIYGPSIPLMFDLLDKKPMSSIKDGKSKMLPVESYGVKILSIGFFTKIDQAVIWRGPMASKALNQMIFDSDWGELDFLLIDLPPGTGDIHLSIMQSLAVTGSVIVSTPQNVALIDARKGVAMFKQQNINVPVLGIIENMAYFSPKELPENKYYIFGKNGAENLASDLNVPFLGCIPIVQSIREASDIGRPAFMQDNSNVKSYLNEITKKMIIELIKRNEKLPATEIIKIKTMSGCSAIK